MPALGRGGRRRVKLFAALARRPDASKAAIEDIAPVLQDYMEMVAGFNPSGQLQDLPRLALHHAGLLREEARDKLKLFEMHPTDSKALAANIAQLKAGRQVAVAREDGFEGLKAFLPPPSRRALVLIDPSYEIKSDYQQGERLHPGQPQALRHRHLRGLVPDDSAARGA